ncbi:MAG: hypothetical protein MZV63_06815 [Marinilabiliales bacterium]|nr:hypothetical protein [Marinilabiliales bacterium]
MPSSAAATAHPAHAGFPTPSNTTCPTSLPTSTASPRKTACSWAPYAVDYLVNGADISYLGDLKFDDGTPLYNERELSHMEDVKARDAERAERWYNFTQHCWPCSGSWSRRGDWMPDLSSTACGGAAWLMVGLAAALGLIVVRRHPDQSQRVSGISSPAFTPCSSRATRGCSCYSDTLIRLFPIRFWQDAFLFAAVTALGGGIALGLGLRTK